MHVQHFTRFSLYCQKNCKFGGMLPQTRCSDNNICNAADIPGPSAAMVSFRWHQPGFPLRKNVDSAASPLLPASHFSGKYTQNANFANQMKYSFGLVNLDDAG